ncbi:uncharacterized protein LOC132557403 [Ylistrum balloti]|uniref:uncharacterized protein LOC132557403 n=1 Tax=Ylistrum balloti TaxID=509963 RepID=UPI002905F0D6|nr:uncharacterized protein LOC132557403 [Ylistrum balloti]XP_060077886.1 uncharacterized protein LOC132557403 [Ylistrum balloti]
MDYHGFYSHRMIQRAQDTLAYSIRNSNNRHIQQVLFKCGLNSNFHRGNQFRSRYIPTPQPHNNLWHEDALKYRYTFPWSDGYNEHHGDSNSNNFRNSSSQSFNDMSQTKPVLHNNLWYEDALGSSEPGYLDFTDSIRGSREDNEIYMTRNYDKELNDYIVVSDSEQQVDLTYDSDEVEVREESNTRKSKNKQVKRKYSSSNTEGSGPSKRPRVQFSQGLVCDYCGFVVPHKLHHHNEEAADLMKCHFKDKKHNAASLAKIQMSDENTGKAISILKESILMTSTDKHVALVNNIVPMCPWKSCNQIHESIWSCAKHYQLYHNNNISTRYSLANVASLKTIPFPVVNTCRTCDMSFSRASEIHKHWKKTQHLKGYLPSSKSQVALYFCPYCNLLSYSFPSCRVHIMHKHKSGTQKDASVKVVFVNRTTEELELLPIQPRPAEAQAHLEITVLGNMKRHAKVYGRTKRARKKIQAEESRCQLKYPWSRENSQAEQTYKAFQRRCNNI